jgi:hypothetical protein
MPQVMVDFRFRESRWQTNGEAAHYIHDHAPSDASCTIRAHVHRALALDDPPPHYHLVESQPGAGIRSYPLGGPIPEVHYKSSHN